MADSNSSQDAATASAQASQMAAVFYRLNPGEARIRLLKQAGILSYEVGTASKAARVVTERKARFLVIDASCGGDGPRRLVSALGTIDWPLLIIWSGPGHPARYIRRVQSLGGKTVHSWPDGVFGCLIEHAQSTPSLTLRGYERVVLNQHFRSDGEKWEGGRVVNLSATGALIQFDSDVGGDAFSFEFALPGRNEPLSVIGKVVRRVQKRSGPLVGLKFVDIEPEQQRAILEFVHRCNVINIGEDGKEEDTRPKIKVHATIVGGTRADYFVLEQLDAKHGTLVPEANFVPPYAPGIELELSVVKPRIKAKLRAVVESSQQLERDGQRLDARTTWRLRFVDLAESLLDVLNGYREGRLIFRRETRSDQRG